VDNATAAVDEAIATGVEEATVGGGETGAAASMRTVRVVVAAM
jgi:hypothetical protein